MILFATVAEHVSIYKKEVDTTKLYDKKKLTPILDVMKEKKVLVIGCGAVGSMIQEALTRNSTGLIVGIDKDYYEEGNIPKSSMAIRYPEDIGRNKAVVLADRLSAVANEGCKHYGYALDLKRIGPNAISFFDYVVLALDNAAMKIFAQTLIKQCPEKSRPICLSCGTNGEFSEAMFFSDKGACLRCTIPDSWLAEEDSETVWSCAAKVNYLLPEKAMPIISTSGIASMKAAMDIDDMITAHSTGAKEFKDSERFTQIGYPRKDGHSSIIMPLKNCPVCKVKPPEDVLELEGDTLHMTLRDLLKIISDKLNGDVTLRVHTLTVPAYIPKTYNQFVINGVCRECGKSFRLNKHSGFIRSDEVICPECLAKEEHSCTSKLTEQEEAVNTFSLDKTPDDILDMTLFDLGYPIGANYEAEKVDSLKNDDTELDFESEVDFNFAESKYFCLSGDKSLLIEGKL